MLTLTFDLAQDIFGKLLIFQSILGCVIAVVDMYNCGLSAMLWLTMENCKSADNGMFANFFNFFYVQLCFMLVFMQLLILVSTHQSQTRVHIIPFKDIVFSLHLYSR